MFKTRSIAQNERFFTPNEQCSSRSTNLPNKACFFFKLLLFAQNKQVSSKWLSLVRMIEYSQKKSLFRPILRHPVDELPRKGRLGGESPKNKAGYTATPVACGWAGPYMRSPDHLDRSSRVKE